MCKAKNEIRTKNKIKWFPIQLPSAEFWSKERNLEKFATFLFIH